MFSFQFLPRIRTQCENLPQQTWQRQAYEGLKSILLANNRGAQNLPCVYATGGYKHNEHRYIFMHSENPSEPCNVRLLGKTMRSYFPRSHSIGANTSLVVFFPRSAEPCSVNDYNQKF